MEKPFPAYSGDEPYVFVCYAHDDSDVVYPEMAWLHEQGVNLWYDEGISPGSEWSQALADAIERCDRVRVTHENVGLPSTPGSRHQLIESEVIIRNASCRWGYR